RKKTGFPLKQKIRQKKRVRGEEHTRFLSTAGIMGEGKVSSRCWALSQHASADTILTDVKIAERWANKLSDVLMITGAPPDKPKPPYVAIPLRRNCEPEPLHPQVDERQH
ncbi:MAG: hypothetical protein OEZ05_10955, partial [Nitrospirota bacterium]|nr:hypothetical protein [Nitrospirota bacterium]